MRAAVDHVRAVPSAVSVPNLGSRFCSVVRAVVVVRVGETRVGGLEVAAGSLAGFAVKGESEGARCRIANSVGDGGHGLSFALYEAMSAHAGLVALLRGRPWMCPNMMHRFSEPAVAASFAAGLTPRQITECHRELFVFTVGCALTQNLIVTGPGTAAVQAFEADAGDLFGVGSDAEVGQPTASNTAMGSR